MQLEAKKKKRTDMNGPSLRVVELIEKAISVFFCKTCCARCEPDTLKCADVMRSGLCCLLMQLCFSLNSGRN